MPQFFETKETPSWLDMLAQGLGQGVQQGTERAFQKKQQQEEQAPLKEYLQRMSQHKIKNAHDQMIPEQAEESPLNGLSQGLSGNGPLTDLSEALSPQELQDRDLANTPLEFRAKYPELNKLVEPAIKRNEEKKQLQQKHLFDQETERYKINEPKLIELAEKQRASDQALLDYKKLEELSSKPENFPSSTLVGLVMDKEGNIPAWAAANLTPEAQEYVKILANRLNGLKDTFGAKITNLDVQSYQKKLPGLLNTPEGRAKILQDLETVENINQLYTHGMQEVFENNGGSRNLDWSQAERIFSKEYAGEMADLNQQYIHPLPTKNMKEGTIYRNKDTGEEKIFSKGRWRIKK